MSEEPVRVELGAETNRLLSQTVKEFRRGRQWRIFIRLLLIGLLGTLLFSGIFEQQKSIPQHLRAHAAIIQVNGPIMATASASAENIIASLEQALKSRHVRGIILNINSPGGSPVQADYVYKAIVSARHDHPNIPIIAVCNDMCASAAYFIASGANQIYADEASLVGSIGVLINGFGFVDAMNKLGVERRLLTAGVNKGFLDPFSPLTGDERARAQTLINDIHQQFIQRVVAGRGDRLSRGGDIFSGAVWTGHQAQQLGLIDGFGSAQQVTRSVLKLNSLIDYTVQKHYFDELMRQLSSDFIGPWVEHFRSMHWG